MTDKFDKINSLIMELNVVEPLPYYEDPSNEGEHFMVEGLAKAYGDRGFRAYIEQEYNRTMSKNLQCKDLYDIMLIKARAATLKELLIKGKAAFQNFSKINVNKTNSTILG